MKSIYLACALGLGAVTLAGCDQKPAEEEVAAAPLTASEGKLFLPAVSGNPGAVYFKLENPGDRAISVRKAEVEGAGSAELHDYMEYDDTEMGSIGVVTVQPGETVSFEPGGKHVMAFDLEEGFGAGDTTKVTLIAAGSRRHSFEATAQAAGDDR